MREQRDRYSASPKAPIIEKRCSTCKVVKPVAGFSGSKITADGYHNVCKDCDRVYKARRVARYRMMNLTARPVLAESFKKCSCCKERLPLSEFTGDVTRRDGLAAICKDCSFSSHKRWRESHYERAMLKSTREGAKRRGLEFTITEQDIVIPDRCPALGVELRLDGSRDFRPSLDRKDNSRGYVPGNVVVVSMRANRTKSDLSIEELRRLVEFYEQA